MINHRTALRAGIKLILGACVMAPAVVIAALALKNSPPEAAPQTEPPTASRIQRFAFSEASASPGTSACAAASALPPPCSSAKPGDSCAKPSEDPSADAAEASSVNPPVDDPSSDATKDVVEDALGDPLAEVVEPPAEDFPAAAAVEAVRIGHPAPAPEIERAAAPSLDKIFRGKAERPLSEALKELSRRGIDQAR